MNPATDKWLHFPGWKGFAATGLLALTGAVCAATSPAAPTTGGPLGADSDVAAKTRALAQANAAVVGIRATAVDDARSIETLGRQRQGSGVVIAPGGLVLTIGYLILEADRVDLVVEGRRSVPARVVAYDLATGFGLLQALTPLDLPPVRLGSSSALSDEEPLM
ncbi:MAG: S1C family serine protease, partial [Rhizobacter sp.]|nr:S1C family serine protease [Rhizobacter sp.]